MGGTTHKYTVYVPPKLPKKPPVIVFLHGYGESGVDGEVQTKVGLGAAIRNDPKRWPFLVVFPQKPVFDLLWPAYTDLLRAILKAVKKEFSPSKSRRYLTGLSQGGNGTFELADKLPWKFAAVAPICGWAEPRLAAKVLQEIPAWIFHGDADEVVPVSSSQVVADWCKKFEKQPDLTIYSGVGHNSWDMAYAEPLPKWFLSHGGKK